MDHRPQSVRGVEGAGADQPTKWRCRRQSAVRSLFGSAVCALLVLVGCEDAPREPSGGERPPVSERELVAISVLTPTAWWLRISPDGSGQIGYGSSIQDEARFPTATFSFPDLRDQLLAMCTTDGTLSRDPAVTFVGSGPATTESLYCSDPGLMASVFERGADGADFGGTRLDALYAAQPPVTVP